MKRIFAVTFLTAAILIPMSALGAESSYSKLDFDKHCKFAAPASEEEAGMGVSGVCQIGDNPTIYFDEGDLRHSAGFGVEKPFESFGQFNRMNTTIEWRHISPGAGPDAAIVRWFIENINPDTGSPDKKKEGQVLVISKVAQPGDATSCIVGMVDARANNNANVLARKIADEMAMDFRCGQDRAAFHGKVGPTAGTPGF